MDRSATTDHARHDLALIAAHAAGDAQATERAAAAALLSTCAACAELSGDLLAIAGATRALPTTARAPRDFTIAADQANRLRRGSWLRTLLRPFASTGSAARPIAAMLTSAGVAGLLVAAFVPGLLGGSPASAPMREQAATAGQASDAPAAPEFGVESSPAIAAAGAGAPTNARGGANAVASINPQRDAALSLASPRVTGEAAQPQAAAQLPGADNPERATPSLLVLGSAGLLLLGLLLFGVRIAARRVR
jgi:hypothetical protein